MKLFFLVAAAVVLLSACGKDPFQTVPQIKIKSLSSTVVPLNSNLQINLGFTDKEGDISEGRLIYQPIRLNKRPLQADIPPYNIDSTTLPVFPKEIEGTMQVTLLYNNLHRSDLENDTINIKFVVYDKAGHKSDTVTTDKIVVLKN
ncbi:MAG: hypothetical protein INR73_19375 [Williamsia sp.]|nr:hypothetical protein [Williamsia sp.]